MIRFRALGLCYIYAPGPAKMTGFDTAGEPRFEWETVRVRPGGWFLADDPTALKLTVGRLAERSDGPEHLRQLLEAVLPALSAFDAAKRAVSVGIDVWTAGDGMMLWRPVRSQQFATLFGGHPPQVDPVFRVEQISGLHRCWRMYRWHGGVVSEVSSA